jgi:hypothetical protein
MKENLLFILFAILLSNIVNAQNVGIGTNDPKAKLDISATNDGFLIPRVELTATTSASPLTTPEESELVYNTATAGTAPNNVVPGYYYWNGSKWVAFAGTGGRDWSLNGNAGTTASTAAINATVNNNFIGTTDNTAFVMATNNLERLRILANGNVGIGETSPGTKLNVKTSTANDGILSTDGTRWLRIMSGTGAGAYNGIVSANDNAIIYSAGTQGTGNFAIAPWANATSGILMNASGNVGVGTAAPLARLHVQKGNATAPTWTIQDADVAIFQNAVNNTALQIVSGTDATSSVLAFSSPSVRNPGVISYSHDNGSNPYFQFVSKGKERLRLPWNGSDAVLQLRSDAVGNWARIGTNGSSLAIITNGVDDISGSSPAMFVGNNGNVGIGFSTLTNKLQVNGNGRFGTSGPNYVFVGSGTSGAGNGGLEIFTTGNVGYIRYHDPGVAWRDLALADAGGNVGIGTAAPGARLDVNASPASGSYVAYFLNNRNTTSELNNGVVIRAGNGVAAIGSWGSRFLSFQRGNGTEIGSITQSAFSTVAYNTTSDKRLKENIKPTDFGIKDLMKINVKDYNYIDDNQIFTGLLAQELYKIIPAAVHVGGEDVKTNPWGIDYGKLTPHLIKAIQEQQTEIEVLKVENAKIAKLEATLEKLESYIYSEAKK